MIDSSKRSPKTTDANKAEGTKQPRKLVIRTGLKAGDESPKEHRVGGYTGG